MTDWTKSQIEDICNAAVNNMQVFWILGDDDVKNFFLKILSPINPELDKNEDVRDILAAIQEKSGLVRIYRDNIGWCWGEDEQRKKE